jgi:peptidoglycan/xylan/chitin deacetylase (PgdA/CDA1 family)
MNIYSRFRNTLGNKNKGRLSKILINFGLKPKVNRKVLSPFEKGIVIFSADFEMAWAFRFSKLKASCAIELGNKERLNVPVILKLLDKHKIPITWATVGHLFLRECRHNLAGFAHTEMKRPGFFENDNWVFKSGDWYQHDPCSDYEHTPAWYAPDLVNQIINAEVKHEIGCHTFSHLDFTYQNCNPELAASELNKCIELADKIGIELKSMVFPGGTAGNFETLREKGFTCYRKPMKYHIDLPYLDKYGLVVLPSSINLDKDQYGWSADYHLKLIKKYIEIASKYRLVCHFWFHPSMDEWYLEKVFPRVLEMINGFKSNRNIDVLSMCEVAEMMLKNSSTNKL